MKLCIITPNVIKGDGQGRANYEIVSEAVRRGHYVTLVAEKVSSELHQSNQINWISISVKKWPTALLRQIVFSWRSANWLRKHRHEFGLIQIYGCVTSAPADINTVVFMHSSWLRSPVHISRKRRDLYGVYQWLYTALNAHWEKQAFSRAKLLVTVSENIKQQLIDIGIPKERVRVIYNGVDLQEFFPSDADRSKFNLPEKVPIALFVGDIKINRKNLDTVLHALVQVPKLHLAVVGDTERSPYPKMAAKLELDARVHFLGYRRDIPKIMQAVDLFVFPSRYEPFGMVVSEAMASGLPVITAKTTGAAEIVTPDCGIVLTDSENVSALAQALMMLTHDRDLRIQMGRSSLEIARQHSWLSKAQKYVDLFEKMSKEKYSVK